MESCCFNFFLALKLARLLMELCLLGVFNRVRHREFIFIVGYNFGTSVSLPLPSLSISLSLFFSLPPSLTH